MNEARVNNLEIGRVNDERRLRELERRTTALEQKVPLSAAAGYGNASGSGAPLIYVLTPGGGIPARVGAVCGVATCEVYQRIDAAGTLADSGTTAVVFNVSTTAVGAGKYGVAGVEGDAWVILVESCT